MERITRDQMLLEMAEVTAKRGTCSRLQVGAVLSRDGRIISTGYNGAPAGLPHCDHSNEPHHPLVVNIPSEVLDKIDWDTQSSRIMVVPNNRPQFHIGGCQTAEHAERNAIAFAARHGQALDRSELHVTHAPCLACARSIINAGVIRVSYRTPYRLTEGIELLTTAGLEVVWLGDDKMIG